MPLDDPVLKGKFFVIDGIDFCGKGTQTDLLVKHLKNHPLDERFKLISVVSTREPFNSHFSLEIRNVLQRSLSPFEKAEKLTELFVDDRKMHLKKLIEPCLKAGSFVVSDRYMYSTLAYQHTQGISFEKLMSLHSGMRIPDLVFIIDIPAEESLRRKALKQDKRPDEMFDKLDFLTELRKNYLALKDMLPDHPIIVINGLRPIEKIFEEIKSKIDVFMKNIYLNL